MEREVQAVDSGMFHSNPMLQISILPFFKEFFFERATTCLSTTLLMNYFFILQLYTIMVYKTERRI